MQMNWIGLWTLTSREVGRFFSVYRQTILPGLISSALYILIFGFTLQQRIAEISGVPYTLFIMPGLIMMNTLTNSSSNTASSMLQMKLLQQLPDILTAPLSSLEISLAYIVGGAVRGFVNGFLVLLLGILLIGLPVQNLVLSLVYIFVNKVYGCKYRNDIGYYLRISLLNDLRRPIQLIFLSSVTWGTTIPAIVGLMQVFRTEKEEGAKTWVSEG